MTDKVLVPRDLLRALADIASENGYPCAGDVYDLLSGETKCSEGEIKVEPRPCFATLPVKSELTVHAQHVLDTDLHNWCAKVISLIKEQYSTKARLGDCENVTLPTGPGEHKAGLTFYRFDDLDSRYDSVVIKIGKQEAAFTARQIGGCKAHILTTYLFNHLKGTL